MRSLLDGLGAHMRPLAKNLAIPPAREASVGRHGWTTNYQTDHEGGEDDGHDFDIHGHH